MHRLACIAAVLCGFVADPARAAIFTVGPAGDTTCAYNQIASAVFAAGLNAGDDVIRVSNAYAHNGSEITVRNQSLVIDGGYANCSGVAASVYATLDGAGATGGPVLSINCLGTQCNVTLRRLVLNNGEDGNLEIAGPSIVYLDQTIVGFSSAAGDGGSVRIDGSLGARLVLDGISFIGNSTAGGNGGAIWCSGTNNSRVPVAGLGALSKANLTGKSGIPAPTIHEIEIFSGIIANGTAVNGGGVYLSNGCRMRLWPMSGFAQISGNTASEQGGGIAIVSGGSLEAMGTSSMPVIITGNAASHGGGVYLDGTGSKARMINTQVTDNTASTRGSGLVIENHAVAWMSAAAATPPCGYPRCSSLSGNGISLPNGGIGGGAHAGMGGQLDVIATHVIGNRAQYGSAFHLASFSTDLADMPTLRISASVIADNHGSIKTVDTTRTTVLIDGSTFSGNRGGPVNALQAVLYASDNQMNGGPITGGIAVTRSLFDGAEGVFALRADNPATGIGIVDVSCVVAYAVHPLVPLPGNSVLASNTMIDPAAGNWRPRPASPAIDRCNAFSALPDTSHDIDMRARGTDNTEVPNAGGTFDAGAYETGTGALFADGFE